MHLRRRRVRAQQVPVTEVEGVVHGAGRVVRRNVEGFEVVVVVFDLVAAKDRIARAFEDLLNAIQRLRDGMEPAERRRSARQRHVDALVL